MDHLLAIRAFSRVVETGGFNRAAQSLQMPNATLSKAISSLEKHLGVKLLERSTRRVSVTADGMAYYQRTQHLLIELDDIETSLGRADANPRGRLRIDTGGSTASALLIPALPDFRVRYPEIQLQIGVTDRTVDLIGENVDCAIRSTAADGSLISRKIATLAWTTCASPAYLKRYEVPTDPRQIASGSLPVVGYFSTQSGKMTPLQFLGKGGQPLEIDPYCDVMVNESNAHVAAARAGMGLVQTLDFAVREAINSGELIAVLGNWQPDPLDVYIAYAPSRQLNTKVRVFVDWITELYERIDGRTKLS